MDLLCPVCAEPWDFDSLHQQVEDPYPGTPTYKNFAEVSRAFRNMGCLALGEKHNDATQNSLPARAAAAMYDMLGDDLDGAAAALEDFEYAGLLD